MRLANKMALVDRDGAGLRAVAAEMRAPLAFEGDIADGAFARGNGRIRGPTLDVVLTAAEVAKAALFLAGEESSFTTGSVLMVEGGWNAA